MEEGKNEIKRDGERHKEKRERNKRDVIGKETEKGRERQKRK